MSRTLYEILSLADTEPREKEYVSLFLKGRLVKFRVVDRQPCNHKDGRFGILVTLIRATRGGIYHEAFEPIRGEMEYLGEAPDQDKSIQRNHHKECPLCDGSGTNFDQRCRHCLGGGRVAYTPPMPERKVEVLISDEA